MAKRKENSFLSKTSLISIKLVVIILLSFPPKGIHCHYTVQSQRNIDPELQGKIDDFIERTYLPASQISGLALAIVQDDGKLLYTTGYGLANKEKGIENGNMTQFMVASVTKTFTATLAVKLLHETFPHLGESVLDTPIRKLLPQVNFTLIDRFRSEQATFRDLLAHRLCLFRDDLELLADPIESTEELTFRQRYNQEVCGFRSEWQYNNQIFAEAGELLGVLAGKPYEEAMQDLMNEIGMPNASFVQRSDDFTQLPFRALPYYVRDNETYPFNPDLMKRLKPLNAAGGLYIHPNEMARYMQFHLNLGTIDGLEIIPREVMGWLYKPSIFRNEFAFKDSQEDLIVNHFAYGLGFMLASYDGWQHNLHTGGMPPHFSLMSLYPGKKLGIFTSTNMSPVLVNQEVLHSFIFETLQGSSIPLEKAMKVDKIFRERKAKNLMEADKRFEKFVEEFKGKPISRNLLDIVGKYGSPTAGDLEITEKFNDQTNQTGYYLAYGPWFRGWLEPAESAGIFKINYDTDIVHDDYAMGFREGRGYIGIDNGTLTYFTRGGGPPDTGVFRLGVGLDLLPRVPWAPGSCGPEV